MGSDRARYLKVDLNTDEVESGIIEEGLTDATLGGSGLALAMAASDQRADPAPLGPETPLKQGMTFLAWMLMPLNKT